MTRPEQPGRPAPASQDAAVGIAPEADDGFVGRWSRRKRATALGHAVPEEAPQVAELVPAAEDSVGSEAEAAQAPPALTDADMPPIESLDEHSDYSGFFSPQVSEALRKLALRKLFRSSVFNVCDGLDDYDEDFRSFQALGDIVTSDMRYADELEARRKAAAEAKEAAARAEAAELEASPDAGGAQALERQSPDAEGAQALEEDVSDDGASDQVDEARAAVGDAGEGAQAPTAVDRQVDAMADAVAGTEVPVVDTDDSADADDPNERRLAAIGRVKTSSPPPDDDQTA